MLTCLGCIDFENVPFVRKQTNFHLTLFTHLLVILGDGPIHGGGLILSSSSMAPYITGGMVPGYPLSFKGCSRTIGPDMCLSMDRRH